MSRLVYVAQSGHGESAEDGYRVRMHDTTDVNDESRELATLLRDRRTFMQLTQQEVADRAGISRQTYNKYESGRTPNPKPGELRAVCRALELDPREVPVALGFVTRDEMNLPPQEDPMPRVLRDIVSLLKLDKVPAKAKESLLRHVQASVDLWVESMGVRKPPREPSAAERAAGKAVTKR